MRQNAADREAGPAGVGAEQAVTGTDHHDVEEVDDEARTHTPTANGQ